MYVNPNLPVYPSPLSLLGAVFVFYAYDSVSVLWISSFVSFFFLESAVTSKWSMHEPNIYCLTKGDFLKSGEQVWSVGKYPPCSAWLLMLRATPLASGSPWWHLISGSRALGWKCKPVCGCSIGYSFYMFIYVVCLYVSLQVWTILKGRIFSLGNNSTVSNHDLGIREWERQPGHCNLSVLEVFIGTYWWSSG